MPLKYVKVKEKKMFSRRRNKYGLRSFAMGQGLLQLGRQLYEVFDRVY